MSRKWDRDKFIKHVEDLYKDKVKPTLVEPIVIYTPITDEAKTKST